MPCPLHMSDAIRIFGQRINILHIDSLTSLASDVREAFARVLRLVKGNYLVVRSNSRHVTQQRKFVDDVLRLASRRHGGRELRLRLCNFAQSDQTYGDLVATRFQEKILYALRPLEGRP